MLTGAALLDHGASSQRVWLMGLSLALIGLLGQPLFEDDFYRYLWDGYRTATAGTPYGVAPEAFFADVDVPEKFRQVLDRVNNPEVPTIYGPVLQGLFYLGYLVDPGNERILRIFWCVANLMLVGVLLRMYPPHRVALYAWNPLVFKEVCLSGHPDVILPLLLCGGWLLRDRLRGIAFGLAVGLAAATKVVALFAVPVMSKLRRPLVSAGVTVATLVLCYLPFLQAQADASDLDGLLVFAERWKFNPGLLFAACEALLGGIGAKVAVVAVVGVAVTMTAWASRPCATPLPQWHRLCGLLLVASPVVNPWYLLWALPAALSTREIWPWAASWAVLLSYATGENLAIGTLAPFEVHPVAYGLQWGLILCALAWDLMIAPRRSEGGAVRTS